MSVAVQRPVRVHQYVICVMSLSFFRIVSVLHLLAVGDVSCASLLCGCGEMSARFK